MSLEEFHDSFYTRRLSEIENVTKSFMTSQFEQNKFFSEELKEHSSLLDAINKQLEEVNLEVSNLQAQLANTENLLGKISDKQTTLVNKMAAKPESLSSNDEDIKMIGATPIESLFSNIKLDKKGTEEESPLDRRSPNCLEGDNLNDENEKVGLERSKL